MKLSPIRITADPTAIVEEVTERITEELDYRIEAANQTEFRAHYEGHPFIRIPEVVPELSTERVLVMDHHDGLRWTAALEQPQELKDAWGEAIYRFVFGSLYDFGVFNADPHPGNYLFHDDGGVTFLDFGCVKRFSPEQVAGDAPHRPRPFRRPTTPDALFESFQDLGCIPRKTKLQPQRVFEWWASDLGPGPGRPAVHLHAEFAAWVMERNFDPFGEWRDIARGMGIGREAKDWTFLMRIQVGLYSVLGALRATGDWRAVHGELVNGDPPRPTWASSTRRGRRLGPSWRCARSRAR